MKATLFFILNFCLFIDNSYSQSIYLKPTFSFGNDIRERFSNYDKPIQSDEIRTKGSLLFTCDLKITPEEFKLKRMNIYGALTGGLGCNFYESELMYHKETIKFKDNFMLYSGVLGVEYFVDSHRNFSFYFEGGLALNYFFTEEKEYYVQRNYASGAGGNLHTNFQTWNIKNSDSRGSIFKVGANLYLGKRSGITFGITRLTLNRHEYNYESYSYIELTQIRSQSGDNSAYLKSFPRAHYYYFNVAYNWIIFNKTSKK